MSDSNENRNRIEDVKRHLYDASDQTVNKAREGVLHPVNHPVPSTWNVGGNTDNLDMKKNKQPTSIFKKFFLGAIIFFIATLGFALYVYINGSPSVSSDKIDIAILGNAFAKGGEELSLQIEITNRNNASLELANLVIEYPKGAKDDMTDMIRLPKESIGTISAGQTITREVKVTLFGDEKSSRNVKAILEYHPEGSNAIFSKEMQFSVTISSAPLSLSIKAPDQATSDQTIELLVTATLNTALPEGATMLQVTYPNNFVFESSTPSSIVGNSIWDLSSLTQTEPLVISIKGKIVGQSGDQQVFHVYAGTTSPSDKSKIDVVYNSLLQSIAITKPFLEARILVDNVDLPVYSASGGETVNVQVVWSNNLASRIADTQLIVNLGGNAFDKSQIDPVDGFYDSANNRIIWDKNTTAELASVEPGAKGSVSFSFKPISLIGSAGSIKSPQVSLDVSIRGNQPSQGSALIDIVTWTLSNSVNSIIQSQAKSVLPIYVQWIGPQNDLGENLSFNQTTREVVWNIGTVRPNTGFDSNREVSFIISLKPSLSQVGSIPQLMKEVSLSGTDSFTNTILKSIRGPITTFLVNDPKFKSGNERVVQ
ncbi:hypothetical protein K8Q96_01550 [Candidatus Nomurabacteria bacterium]|nr:hypothetical protein [Candidatus Nomurabacteria bacterium]